MNSTAYMEKISSLFGRIIANSLQSQIPSELADIDLTFQQYHVMIYASQHTPCSIGNIASGMSISHPAAVGLIERLQRKRLVVKSVDRQDRRITCVSLTPLGHQVVDKVQAQRSELIARALQDMTPAEQAALISGMEKLLTATLQNESLIESVCLRCGVSHSNNCIVNRSHVALTGAGIEKT